MRRPALAALTAAAVATSLAVAAPAPAHAVGPATTVTVTGAGFGHGVGMSQWGAFGQASEGRTAEQILSYYYTGTTVAPVPDARDIRVNVGHAVRSLPLSAGSVDASGGGGWRLTVAGQPTVDLALTDRAGVTAAQGAVKVDLTRTDGTTQQLTGASLLVEWGGAAGALAGAPATVLTAGSDQLRHGTLTVTPSSAFGGAGNRLEAVTSLPLHDRYLYGIAEVPSSWPTEVLRAQAIAARSYAYKAVLDKPDGIRACGGCHVYDTVASQAFAGWKKESESFGGQDYGARWRAAVDATVTDAANGLAVLDSTGAPIKTYYFSSSGGKTRNSEWVWTAPLTYAKSVDDPWSLGSYNPYASWTEQIPAARVAGAFGLTSLTAITVTGRDGSDAATSVDAVDGNGVRKTISGEEFRRALGLRSAWVRTIALDTDVVLKDPPGLSLPYRSSGDFVIGGRAWKSDCKTFGATLRCVALPFTTRYVYTPDRKAIVRKEAFYAAAVAQTAPVAPVWDTNPWARPGSFTDSSGRLWNVTCTEPTGPRLCKSTVRTKVLVRQKVGGKYRYARVDMDLVRRFIRLTAVV